jgi:hypothetical protein
MKKLTNKQIALLGTVFVQYCEECDSSPQAAKQIDALWAAILELNRIKEIAE